MWRTRGDTVSFNARIPLKNKNNSALVYD